MPLLFAVKPRLVVITIALATAVLACGSAERSARVASVGGHAPTPLAVPTSAPGPADPQTTLILNGWIEVTVRLPPESTEPVPVVLSPFVPDELLLERGIGTVHFRTRWERLRGQASARHRASCGAPCVGQWLLASPRPENVGRYYFSLIGQDALHSIPRIVDYLQTRPEMDPTRISIAGSSTSGFTALEALAAEPRLAMGVVRAACGDYHLFLRSSALAFNDDPRWLPDGRLALDPKYEAVLTRREPIAHVDRLPPRPLLLMTGEVDRTIPAACSRKTAAALAQAYARRGAEDRFRFVEFPGVGHNLGPPSEQAALEWWERWL